MMFLGIFRIWTRHVFLWVLSNSKIYLEDLKVSSTSERNNHQGSSNLGTDSQVNHASTNSNLNKPVIISSKNTINENLKFSLIGPWNLSKGLMIQSRLSISLSVQF